MDDQECAVPFTVLRDAPFNLAFQELVSVRVAAINFIGSSEYSQENTAGATIQTPPGLVTTLGIDPDISSIESIGLVW